MKLNLPLLKKCFKVGTKDDLRDDGMPWAYVQEVWVEMDQHGSHARAKANEIDAPYIERYARRYPIYDQYSFEDQKISMIRIQEILAEREWRAKMEKMVAENPGRNVYIWSNQWGQYWKSGGCGYSPRIKDAGVYGIEDAWKRTQHTSLIKGIEFELIP